MLLKGLRFGMLLQLAIGPIALFIFQTAAQRGFWSALGGVLGTALVDGGLIILAILGVGALLERSKGAKAFLKYFGSAILFLFGAANLLGAFEISILPSLGLSSGGANAFVTAMILALSNPLTILFWAGVFSAKLTELNMQRRDLNLFALGCVCATILFLTFLSLLGHVTRSFLPDMLLTALNALVGVVMILFGLRNLRGKKADGVESP